MAVEARDLYVCERMQASDGGRMIEVSGVMRRVGAVFAMVCAIGLHSAEVPAASSSAENTQALTARLVTAEDGVAPGRATLSAGLVLELETGWKVYWRSPGEVGLPPQIDWSGSENLGEAEFLWPAPERFRAFGIENYGYKDAVTFPVRIRLDEPGAATRLSADVRLLACSDICVPQEFTLSLTLPGGAAGIDTASADLVAAAAGRVPEPAAEAGFSGIEAALTHDEAALVVAFESATPLDNPSLFPETEAGTAFGAPEIRLSDGGRRLWARLPVTSPEPPGGPVRLTVTDGARAGDFAQIPLAEAPPAPPYEAARAGAGALDLLWIAGVAFLGGLILNVMPCVLPVLSIKLASAVKGRERSRAEIRTGFLISALGVLAFMWVLAGATLGLRAAGLSVGWGLQFQNPVFLAAMIALLALFSANLAGLFEITLPARWTTAMDRAESRRGHLGDFLTGAFAAVLATPCSAPFLGTAVTFALAGRALDIVVVFTALGLGLGLPYLAVAARPGMVAALPRPGRWMLAVKLALAALLALTAGWLVWVLVGVAGPTAALAVLGALAAGLALLALRRLPDALRGAGLAGALAVALTAPALITPPAVERGESAGAVAWAAFDSAAIPGLVSRGEVVFVDVTADWCLTCKANKALVLSEKPVAGALAQDGVTAMQADWTRRDPAISRYLARHDRYAIPFNIVYGPGAPEGIVLPELLDSATVMAALERARAATDQAGG